MGIEGLSSLPAPRSDAVKTQIMTPKQQPDSCREPETETIPFVGPPLPPAEIVTVESQVLSSPGLNSYSDEEKQAFGRPDLSSLFHVKVVSGRAAPKIDLKAGTITVGRDVDDLQPKVAEEIVSAYWAQGKAILLDQVPHESKADAVDGLQTSVSLLNELGFVDQRLALMQVLVGADLPRPAKLVLAGIFERNMHSGKIGKVDKEKLIALYDSEVRDEIAVKGKGDPKALDQAVYQVGLIGYVLTQFGVAENEANSATVAALKKYLPGFYQKIAAVYNNLSPNAIAEKLLERSKDPATRRGSLSTKEEYYWELGIVRTLLTEEAWASLPLGWSETNKETQALYERIDRAINYAEVKIAKELVGKYIERTAYSISSLDRTEREKAKELLIGLIDNVRERNLFSREETVYWLVRMDFPMAPSRLAELYVQQLASVAENRQVAREVLAEGYAQFAAQARKIADPKVLEQAKKFGQMLNQDGLIYRREVPGLSSSLEIEAREKAIFACREKVADLKEKYLALFRQAAGAAGENDRPRFAELRAQMKELHKKVGVLFVGVKAALEEIAEVEKKDDPDGEKHYNFTPVLSSEGDYLSDSWELAKFIFHERRLKGFGESMRKKFAGDSQASNYSPLNDNLALTSWDLDARLDEINSLFTAERKSLIERFSKQYAVPPALLAAIVLTEQKDQTYAENITDLLSAVSRNPSVGLGQVTVKTARELFPEKLKNYSNLRVAWNLNKDKFGLEAAAAALDKYIKEGEQHFGRLPTIEEIGSRYTSSTYEGMRRSWGRLVKQSYDDIMIAGLFGGNSLEALQQGFETYQAY